jgi:hypothetical protein
LGDYEGLKKMLTPGEEILIEKVSNGFIVSPKDITHLTRLADIHVFGEMVELEKFLERHFNHGEEKR